MNPPGTPPQHDPVRDADAASEVRYRLGRLGPVSVNTWIIAINVIVFLLCMQAVGGTPVRTSWGTFTVGNPTREQLARAVTDRRNNIAMPDLPGVFYHPIYDPKEVVRSPDGRVLIHPQTGGPVPVLIGGERWTERPRFESWGHFSTGKFFVDGQLWRVLTFQFLHFNWVHLAFNMLGLWFIGGLVEEYLGRRRYLVFYLACGVAGSLMYLALNVLGWLAIAHISPAIKGRIPALLFDDLYTPLIGASAGVFGVLMAAAKIAPRQIVQVAFILPLRLATAVYLFIALSMVNLLSGGNNAGGDAAHLGGALAGAYLVRNPHALRDIVRFVPRWPVRRTLPARPATVEQEIDRILDKADDEGTESLTPREREFLHRVASDPRTSADGA
ncbi:MAG: rhomboid family intramembrane serine protease [Phycisphaeraceae bacterium]|nr:rhomboid family intramembrane serine protease [Phycisphaeraceae bacterium]